MPESNWKRQLLTREDVGYGPARQYESAPGSEEELPRERRGAKRSVEEVDSGLGPYHQRLQRQRRPDPWILADIQESLFLDTWIDADRITVEVSDGEVTLFGTLASRREVGEALKDARKVPGVRKLNNRLEVET